MPPGQTLTKRLDVYLGRWSDRCYPDDIPDEAPEALVKQGRVPSWKGIALAILKNDHTLKTLGCGIAENDLVRTLRKLAKPKPAPTVFPHSWDYQPPATSVSPLDFDSLFD